MAIYHLSASVVKRSEGRSAVAASAYRSASRLNDERYGIDHDYTRKRGVVHTEIVAPDDAPEWMRDRSQLWNAVEKVETRKNARLARDITVALPHELTAEQRCNLVRQFAYEQFVSRGMIADIAIHEPHRKGDDRNHHAHLMLTMRELTGDGFHAKKSTPEARRWNERETLEDWRVEWAAIQNREFERLGIVARVDHRSLKAQGIERDPSRHDGPAITNMKRQGHDIEQPAQSVDRIAANDNSAELSAELSAALVKVQKELVKLRSRQRDLEAEKAGELSAQHSLSVMELKQRQEDERSALAEKLVQHYRPHLAEVESEAAEVTDRLENSGLVRGIFRDLTGRTRADREQLDKLQATIDSAHQRMQEQRDALAKRHREELALAEARFADRQENQRKAIYDAQVESAAQAAGGGKKLTYAQRLALRAERSQEPAQQREQTNQQRRDKGRDFEM